MIKVNYLVPRNFRFVGIFFVIAGAVMGVARFIYGFKPDFLDMKQFALYSEYLESKYMRIIKNNMGEEVTGLLLMLGLFLIAFSREKTEDETTEKLRLTAFIIATWVNVAFIMIALFFTYGIAFIYMLIINMIVFLSAYIIAFRILYIRYNTTVLKK
jgi:hypothetical protein